MNINIYLIINILMKNFQNQLKPLRTVEPQDFIDSSKIIIERNMTKQSVGCKFVRLLSKM